jgi:hypothetical protein
MPRLIEPMMASLRPGLPHDDDRYGWEFKWDGVRAVAHISSGQLRLLSRIIKRKRKLKKIQYRPHLIDGCLAATGLEIEPW